MINRPVFGDLEHLRLATGLTALVEVGWHPVCGHVRHKSATGTLEMPLNPALTYGLLPRGEVIDRGGTCPVCMPGEQLELL